MEGKSRQNRIVNNRIPFEQFVRLFAVIEIVLAFLYAKCFTTFSVYGSRILGISDYCCRPRPKQSCPFMEG